jgi:hypothetical protein
MALIPGARYSGQTDAAGAYPLGKARNASAFGDGTGTPLEKDWLNDLWGFQQALLAAAEIVASGDPDEVGASQYLDALRAVASASSLSRNMRGAMQLRQVNLNGTTPPSGDEVAVASANGRTLIAKAGTNGVFRLADTSLIELGGVTATGGGAGQDIAFNGSNRHVSINGGASAFSTNNGAGWTAGGSLGGGWSSNENRLAWSGTHFVAVDAGTGIKRSTNGVAWAAVTTPPAVNGGGIAVLTPGTLIMVDGGTGAPDVSISTDHGDTWAAAGTIPTALTDCISYCVGRAAGEVYAFVKVGGFDPGALVECWVTTDGSTWTKRSEIPDGHIGVFGDWRAFQCQDTGLLLVATQEDTADTVVSASGDLGRTWAPLAHYNDVLPFALGVANGRIIGANGTRIHATDPLI